MKKEITLADVYKLIEDFRKEVKDTYVTKIEFAPVKAIAYGIVGAASISVLAAVLGKVVIAAF